MCRSIYVSHSLNDNKNGTIRQTWKVHQIDYDGLNQKWSTPLLWINTFSIAKFYFTLNENWTFDLKRSDQVSFNLCLPNLFKRNYDEHLQSVPLISNDF